MANHQHPDRNVELMERDHGTVCLITDLQADRIIKAQQRKDLRRSKEPVDAWTI